MFGTASLFFIIVPGMPHICPSCSNKVVCLCVSVVFWCTSWVSIWLALMYSSSMVQYDILWGIRWSMSKVLICTEYRCYHIWFTVGVSLNVWSFHGTVSEHNKVWTVKLYTTEVTTDEVLHYNCSCVVVCRLWLHAILGKGSMLTIIKWKLDKGTHNFLKPTKIIASSSRVL